jgi:hypothetical protein
VRCKSKEWRSNVSHECAMIFSSLHRQHTYPLIALFDFDLANLGCSRSTAQRDKKVVLRFSSTFLGRNPFLKSYVKLNYIQNSSPLNFNLTKLPQPLILTPSCADRNRAPCSLPPRRPAEHQACAIRQRAFTPARGDYPLHAMMNYPLTGDGPLSDSFFSRVYFHLC